MLEMGLCCVKFICDRIWLACESKWNNMYCDICCGRQIPGLRWPCSRKPKLKAAKGSEDIQDKDYQTQYKYNWSK